MLSVCNIKLRAHLELSYTAMLILDPAEVLAQQQKAAANRSPAAANQAPSTAQNAAVVSKGAPQHVAQMPGHATNMMYRPVANAAATQPAMSAAQGPGKPSLLNNRAQFMHNIQHLLAFADIRWKETNQTEKRKAARKLVADVKQACGIALYTQIYMPYLLLGVPMATLPPECECYPGCNQDLQLLQDPSKTQLFQQGILRLVGDELVSEFQLTRADRPASAIPQVLFMLSPPPPPAPSHPTQQTAVLPLLMCKRPAT